MNLAASQLKSYARHSQPPAANILIIYTASDKAVHLMQDGRKLANLFEQSASISQDARSIAKSDLLRETYRPGNIYHATDLINRETGELFDGYGVLINSVNSRLSKAYLKAQSSRARKGIREKLSKTKLFVGERYRFLTLTMPYLRADVATVLKIKDRAMVLLKKRQLWTRNVRAALVSEEITIGESSTSYFTHFNAHNHALLVGKYIDHSLIANLWTDCVERACAEFGVEFLMRNLVSNRLTVDIQDVATYSKKHGKTLDDSIEELCKYVTQGSEFEKVPVAEIVEIDRALFKRQMIKSYGDFNNQKGTGKKENPTALTSLDTKYITDGDTRHQPERIKLKHKRTRGESLVDIGTRLILEGRRGEWLQMIAATMEYRRQFRADYLARKFPHATFRTLDGKRWFGVSERPPQVVVSLSDFKRTRERLKAMTSPYPLPILKTASITQVKRMSNWELFNSFCDLSNEKEAGEFLA
jgi:hypothetical protein